jgi:hypothetical protein
MVEKREVSKQPKKHNFTKLASDFIFSIIDRYRFRGTSKNLMPGMLNLSKKMRETEKNKFLSGRNATVIKALDHFRIVRESLIEKDEKANGLMYRWAEGKVTREEQIAAEKICETAMKQTAIKFGVTLEDMQREMHEQVSDFFPE